MCLIFCNGISKWKFRKMGVSALLITYEAHDRTNDSHWLNNNPISISYLRLNVIGTNVLDNISSYIQTCV